jgi:hypothetical protein
VTELKNKKRGQKGIETQRKTKKPPTHSLEDLHDRVTTENVLLLGRLHDGGHAPRELNEPESVDLNRFLLGRLSFLTCGRRRRLEELKNRHDRREVFHPVEDNEDLGREDADARRRKIGSAGMRRTVGALASRAGGGDRVSIPTRVDEERERRSLYAERVSVLHEKKTDQETAD